MGGQWEIASQEDPSSARVKRGRSGSTKEIGDEANEANAGRRQERPQRSQSAHGEQFKHPLEPFIVDASVLGQDDRCLGLLETRDSSVARSYQMPAYLGR